MSSLSPFLSVHSHSHLQIIWLSSSFRIAYIYMDFSPVYTLICLFKASDQEQELLHWVQLRLFSCMNFHMIFQITWLRAREITLSATVRLFTSVYSHMSFQSIWSRTRVITLSASVRLFSCVNPHMYLQIIWLRARVITLSATVRLFSCVNPHMFF